MHIKRGGSGWIDYGDTNWDKERPAKKCFDEIFRVSKNQIIWGGNYFADLFPPKMRWLVWDKGQRNFSLADGELAWTSFNKALRIFDYSRALALKDGKVHPTQKALQLMIWCVVEHTEKGDLILDPFMGSGTTAVACIKTERNFIGFEIDKGYYEIACKRIEAEKSQMRLAL